jgi:hypothetical protein
MEALPVILLVLLGISAAAAIGYFVWKAEQKRTDELRAFALELGWTFSSSRRSASAAEFANFGCFQRGHSRSAFNTLEGVIEVAERAYDVRMGDFRYKVTSGSGKNRRTHTYTFSYAVVRLPFGSVPPLLIRRERLLDKLAGAFGFPDINFESAEFSRRYCVKSPDRRFAYDVIDQRMIEFLLRTDPPAIEISRGRCCLTNGSGRWSADEFRARHAWLHEFFQHWPRHLKAALDEAS